MPGGHPSGVLPIARNLAQSTLAASGRDDLFPNAITPLKANLSQGEAMGLTVAMEFVPPQCFALANGTGEGTLKGDQFMMTLRLNDGGKLTIKGRVRQDKTTKGHLQDGTFEMTGECQSKGTVALDKP